MNSDSERIWAGVSRGAPDECWLWTRSRDKGGYGKTRLGGKCIRAHRAVWKIERGEIPTNIFVCHHCDTPPCCNPDHLFLGTLQDNHADMMAKKRHVQGDRTTWRRHPELRPTVPKERHARGEKIANAKLREEDARCIQAALSHFPKKRTKRRREAAEQFAARLGVSLSTVYRCRTATWQHVAGVQAFRQRHETGGVP